MRGQGSMRAKLYCSRCCAGPSRVCNRVRGHLLCCERSRGRANWQTAPAPESILASRRPGAPRCPAQDALLRALELAAPCGPPAAGLAAARLLVSRRDAGAALGFKGAAADEDRRATGAVIRIEEAGAGGRGGATAGAPRGEQLVKVRARARGREARGLRGPGPRGAQQAGAVRHARHCRRPGGLRPVAAAHADSQRRSARARRSTDHTWRSGRRQSASPAASAP